MKKSKTLLKAKALLEGARCCAGLNTYKRCSGCPTIAQKPQSAFDQWWDSYPDKGFIQSSHYYAAKAAWDAAIEKCELEKEIY